MRIILVTTLIFLLLPASAQALQINELMPNPEGYDDASMPSGEWIKLYNEEDHAVSLEGFYIYDAANKYLRITTENTVPSNLLLQPNQDIIVYRNQNKYFSLNNDGDTIRLLDNYHENNPNTLDTFTYTTTQEGQSSARFADESESTVQIIERTEQASFGDIITVRLTVYRGDTSESTVVVYLNDGENTISESDEISVDKFETSEFEVNLYVPLDCTATQPKELTTSAEGLGEKDTKTITVFPAPCPAAPNESINITCPVCKCPGSEPIVEIVYENKSCPAPTTNKTTVLSSPKKQNLNTAKNLFIVFLVFIVLILLKPTKK